jgi:hypothetical protein
MSLTIDHAAEQMKDMEITRDQALRAVDLAYPAAEQPADEHPWWTVLGMDESDGEPWSCAAVPGKANPVELNDTAWSEHAQAPTAWDAMVAVSQRRGREAGFTYDHPTDPTTPDETAQED